jgi:hypothetical protein
MAGDDEFLDLEGNGSSRPTLDGAEAHQAYARERGERRFRVRPEDEAVPAQAYSYDDMPWAEVVDEDDLSPVEIDFTRFDDDELTHTITRRQLVVIALLLAGAWPIIQVTVGAASAVEAVSLAGWLRVALCTAGVVGAFFARKAWMARRQNKGVLHTALRVLLTVAVVAALLFGVLANNVDGRVRRASTAAVVPQETTAITPTSLATTTITAPTTTTAVKTTTTINNCAGQTVSMSTATLRVSKDSKGNDQTTYSGTFKNNTRWGVRLTSVTIRLTYKNDAGITQTASKTVALSSATVLKPGASGAWSAVDYATWAGNNTGKIVSANWNFVDTKTQRTVFDCPVALA